MERSNKSGCLGQRSGRLTTKMVRRLGSSMVGSCATFGVRHFLKTKAQAETKADQLRTLRRNEGASALSLSAADRIDAEAALSLLAPHHRSLREAAEFFVKHLGIFQSAKTVSELFGELVAKQAAGRCFCSVSQGPPLETEHLCSVVSRDQRGRPFNRGNRRLAPQLAAQRVDAK